MTQIREKAAAILIGISEQARRKRIDAEIWSDGDTAADYTYYTTLTQQQLEADWNRGVRTTGCHYFVQWYANQLGSAYNLGRFDVEPYLTSIDKGHAWVKSARGRQPQYGDILRHTITHMDVALDIDDDGILSRMAAGQGGPEKGRDILKRARGNAPYNYANLQGWIDLDLFFGPAPIPVPLWLIGWWKVSWRMQTYYYHFSRTHQAIWTMNRPASNSLPPIDRRHKGRVAIGNAPEVTIHWNESGSVEELNMIRSDTPKMKMSGTWNGLELLSAEEM